MLHFWTATRSLLDRRRHMYGKSYMGIQRATFLIDSSGKIVRVWPKVKPEGHAEEVLEAVRALA